MQINLVPDASLLAIVVIFFLNYLVVRRFFTQPITDVLDARESESANAERLYEESLSHFNQATAEMEGQLHTAKKDAAQVRDRFRGEAAVVRNQAIERTQSEAKKIVAEAEQKVTSEVKAARQKIVGESESLARLAAERILGRPV